MKLSSVLSVLLLALSTEVAALGKLWGHMKPTSFKNGDVIDVHVGQLWSLVIGTLPYDFYSLRWCDSLAGHQYDSTLLKEKKTYDSSNDSVNARVHESPYAYKVGEQKEGIIACRRIIDQSQ